MARMELNLGVAAIIALSSLACSPQADAVENPNQNQTASASSQPPPEQGLKVLSEERIRGIKLEQLTFDITRSAKKIRPNEGTSNGRLSVVNLSGMDLLMDPQQFLTFADQCGVNRSIDRYTIRFINQQSEPSSGAKPYPIRTSFNRGAATITINRGDTDFYVRDQLADYEITPDLLPRARANLRTIVDNQFLISALCTSADLTHLNRRGNVTDGEIARSQALADTKASVWRRQLLAGTSKAAVVFVPGLSTIAY